MNNASSLAHSSQQPSKSAIAAPQNRAHPPRCASSCLQLVGALFHWLPFEPDSIVAAAVSLMVFVAVLLNAHAVDSVVATTGTSRRSCRTDNHRPPLDRLLSGIMTNPPPHSDVGGQFVLVARNAFQCISHHRLKNPQQLHLRSPDNTGDPDVCGR